MRTKYIEISQIAIEGFRSYVKPTLITLEGVGLTLIKGDNGAGKTTMFSALCWVLYKINLNGNIGEKVQSFERLRGSDYRGTRVVVYIRDGNDYYMIARHLNFKGTTKGLTGKNSLLLFKIEAEEGEIITPSDFTDADLVSEEQHKKDQEGYIRRLLGVDEKMFLNSILFGQRMVRLISSPNDDKRELFEKMFDLLFIKTAKVKADNKKIEVDTEIAVNTQKISTLENSIDYQQRAITEKQGILDNFEVKKQERVSEAEKEADITKKEISILNADLIDAKSKVPSEKEELTTVGVKLTYDEAGEMLADSKSMLSEYKANNLTIDRELNRAKENKVNYETQLTNIKTDCPTCGKPLAADKIKPAKDNLKSQITAEDKVIDFLEIRKKSGLDKVTFLEESLILLQKSYDEASEKYQKVKVALDNINTLKNKVTLIEQQLVNEKKTLERQELTVQKEKEEKPPEYDLMEIRKKIATIDEDLAKLVTKQVSLGKKLIEVKWWQKAFGASGLKAFVFSTMLDLLNSAMEKYANRLGYGCRFSIDMSKDSKPFTTECFRNGHMVDYADLSGGQKQMLDVVISFAMHDIVTETVSDFNLLILDEVFEGLSANNMDATFDLIRTKCDKGKAVYVITHIDNIDSLGAKNWYVQLDANESTYIQ